MTIYLNKKEISIQESSSILDMLSAQEISMSGIAVAVDNQVVTKELWATTQLCENSNVTVIIATFGG